MKTASWIVLALAGALTVLASLASLSNAYFSGQEQIGGVAIDKLADGNPQVITALRARRATAAAYAAGFGAFLLLIALGPYRRGDAWAWYAILIGTLTQTLLTFARMPFLGTRAGTGTALVQLVVVGVGLALGAGRLRRLPVAVILLAVAASPAQAETHRLVPKVGHPTFAVRPPVLTVRPGDVARERDAVGRVVREAPAANGRAKWGRSRSRARSPATRWSSRSSRSGPTDRPPSPPRAAASARSCPTRGHRVPERDVPARPLRLAARPRAHDGHGGPARQQR